MPKTPFAFFPEYANGANVAQLYKALKKENGLNKMKLKTVEKNVEDLIRDRLITEASFGRVLWKPGHFQEKKVREIGNVKPI